MKTPKQNKTPKGKNNIEGNISILETPKAEIAQIKQTPKATPKEKSFQTPKNNGNQSSKKKTPKEDNAVTLEQGTPNTEVNKSSKKKLPKIKLDESASELSLNNSEDDGSPTKESTNTVSKNKKRKRKSGAKLNEQTETVATPQKNTEEVSVKTPKQKNADKSVTSDSNTKPAIRELLINFPRRAVNYKPAMLEVLKHSEIVCYPKELIVKFSSPEEALEKMAQLKNITIDGRHLYLQQITKKTDPLKRIIMIREEGVNKEDIKEQFGADTMQQMPNHGSRPSILYILTFKNEEAANEADSKTVTVNNVPYTTRIYYVNEAPIKEAKAATSKAEAAPPMKKQKVDSNTSKATKKSVDEDEDEDEDEEEADEEAGDEEAGDEEAGGEEASDDDDDDDDEEEEESDEE